MEIGIIEWHCFAVQSEATIHKAVFVYNLGVNRRWQNLTASGMFWFDFEVRHLRVVGCMRKMGHCGRGDIIFFLFSETKKPERVMSYPSFALVHTNRLYCSLNIPKITEGVCTIYFRHWCNKIVWKYEYSMLLLLLGYLILLLFI